MEHTKLKAGDIVQITREGHQWYPCIVVVSEPKGFGCQGYVSVPMQGDAYIRLNHDDFEIVGKAAVIAS